MIQTVLAYFLKKLPITLLSAEQRNDKNSCAVESKQRSNALETFDVSPHAIIVSLKRPELGPLT